MNSNSAKTTEVKCPSCGAVADLPAISPAAIAGMVVACPVCRNLHSFDPKGRLELLTPEDVARIQGTRPDAWLAIERGLRDLGPEIRLAYWVGLKGVRAIVKCEDPPMRVRYSRFVGGDQWELIDTDYVDSYDEAVLRLLHFC